MIRPDVHAFLALTPLPAENGADEARVRQLQDLLDRIARPITREEAILLSRAFGPDGCYGMAWALLHLIETVPGGVPLDAIPEGANIWTTRLHRRSRSRAP